jgi:hypothetical protein
MWDKTRQGGPAVGLLAASGVLTLFTAVSACRLSLRLLEKRWSASMTWPATSGGATTQSVLTGRLRASLASRAVIDQPSA